MNPLRNRQLRMAWNKIYIYIMSENKMIKTITDASVVVGIAAGIGYIGKKAMKESFINDPSASLSNYGKWVAVLAGSMYLKQYLEDQKILPKYI